MHWKSLTMLDYVWGNEGFLVLVLNLRGIKVLEVQGVGAFANWMIF